MMKNNKSVFNWQVYVGVILILTGGIFLADLFLPIKLMASFWPVLIVLFGISFFIAMLAAGKRGSGLAIPGAIITTLGLLLSIQNTFRLWVTWSYAWALLISATGFGILIMNIYLKKVVLRRVAGLLIGLGLTLFVVFGILFEIILDLSGANLASGVFLGGGLVLLGLFVVFSRSLFQRAQKSVDKVIEAEPEVVEAKFEEPETSPVKLKTASPLLPTDEVFDIVVFEGAGDVFVNLGDVFSLEVEGNGDVREQMDIEVRDNELRIKNRTKVNDWRDPDQVASLTPFQYRVTMPKVIQLVLSGAGSLTADHLAGKQLNVVHNSLGRMILKGLAYETLMVNHNGQGELVCEGKVRTQSVAMSGEGDYHAEDLRCEEAIVGLSNKGSAFVWAEERLEANVDGLGDLNYKGQPEITQSITGTGSVKPLSPESD
jgi:hypothetical protein